MARLKLKKYRNYHHILLLFVLFVILGQIPDIKCDTTDSNNSPNEHLNNSTENSIVSQNSTSTHNENKNSSIFQKNSALPPELENFKATANPLPVPWEPESGASVALSWKLKDGVLSPLKIIYQIQYSLKDDSTMEEIKDCDSDRDDCKEQELNVEQLNPCSQYEFSIKAKFEGGNFGETTRTTVFTLPTVASPPRNFKLSSRTKNSITLEWERPEREGYGNNGFKLAYEESSFKTGKNDEIITQDVKQTVLGLDAFSSYTFTLISYYLFESKTCKGEPAALTIRTLAGEPSVPLNVVQSVKSSSTVHLSWSKPLKPAGNLDGYIISWKSEDGLLNDAQNIAGDKLETDISKLEPYTEYTFSILAFNINEDDGNTIDGKPLTLKATTYVAAPGPVMNLEFKKTSKSLSMAWNEPIKLNGPIDGYCVSISSGSENCNNGKETRIIDFSDLTPYTNYSIKVLAYNYDNSNSPNKGKMLRGESQQVTERTKADMPGAPNNFVVKVVSSTKTDLSWEIPSETNGPLDGFTISWKKNGGSLLDSRDFDATQMTFSVENLEPYTIYQFSILAFNFVEDDVRLESNKVEKTVSTFTLVPSNFEAKVVRYNTVDLSWNNPIDKSQTFNGFRITWKEVDSDSLIGEMDLENAINIYSIQNLDPYTNYHFSVLTYVIKDKEKIYGNPVEKNVTTYTSEPDKVDTFEVENVGSTSLFAKWTEPKIKNGPIDGYVLRYSSNKNEEKSLDVVYLKRELVIDNLQPYTNYTISLLAYNVYRPNAPEEKRLYGTEFTIYQMTDTSAPSDPTDVAVEFNNTSSRVTLSWREPSEPNGPIDGYCVKYKQRERYPGDETVEGDILVKGTDFEFDALFWREFDLEVFAFNDNQYGTRLNGSISSKQFQTPIGRPSKPGLPQIEDDHRKNVTVVWSAPLPLTGPTVYNLTFYEGNRIINESDCEKELDIKTKPKPPLVIHVDDWNVTRKEIGVLKPFTCYEVQVTAIVGNYDSDLSSSSDFSVAFQTLKGVPFPPDNNLSSIAVHQKSMEFFIPSKLFILSNEKIQRCGIIVTKVNMKEDAESFAHQQREYGEILDETELPSWENVQINSSITKYKATPYQWNPFEKEDSTFNCTEKIQVGMVGHQCILGAQVNCTEEKFCNGPLLPGTAYRINFRRYSNVGFADSYALEFVTVSEQQGNSSPVSATLIAVIVSGSILALVLIVFAAVSYKKEMFCFKTI